ncbi:MAG: acetyl-CoA carboxylase, carboxyltransferase subunit beta [Armatimonadetes bacterium]|nr:acetyl-CoA carboxylase, carboxyltransferase subunit beta [Armatimonadota bacterium]
MSRSKGDDAATTPDWVKCARCKELVYRKEWENLLRVCPRCNYHQRLRAGERIAMLVDEGSFREFGAEFVSADPLGFPDYADKLRGAAERTGLPEAIVTGEALLGGYPVILGVLDFHFRAGTMNAAVGEKVTRAMERAVEQRKPVLMSVATGGARVEEGLHSLMQMAKTSAAVARMQAAGVPYLVLLTDPSLAGTMASYASLGDVILAEPGALIGFTGRRVIEQTLRIQLPDDFQTAEFHLQNGFVDMVCDRARLRATVIGLLSWFLGPRPAGLRTP